MTRNLEDELITAALNRAGLPVGSVVDLLTWKRTYPQAAISVLVESLSRIQDKGIKEAIIRALAVKEARGKADKVLISEFYALPSDRNSNDSCKWAIGSTLEVVATDAVFDDLIAIVKDKKHGLSRQMIAVALGNIKNPTAVDVLIGLLDDGEVSGHALIALRRLGAARARPYVERFLEHPTPWIRNEAIKLIAKLDKTKVK
jgi:HEAT repeat protein